MTLGKCVQPIIDARLADLVEMDQVITDEVRLVQAPGHTPGHVSVAIESGGRTAFITGDLIFDPVQWAEIERGSDAHGDAAAAESMRRHIRDRYTNSGHLIIGTHFAPPTAGHVIKDGERWSFRSYVEASQEASS
ncbi:glyoxylase-like metal-dependent hydrolase (beta-lactamase superfamily II) [Sphingobium sp. OAS761]|uniref:MBL fold metallo-hydrolase n=1 Tax=Sphingobium sp. OAS761 TaxID=2817901 RepID=UPI0020A1E34F|nr:MBL fold metallo-hydrolase [Sphingobium sp. OAS761]MCP1471711.1 glyoxylase-like metal-dependent hydrolase (beta-lactamase superfamily II) [Sphingobium sp. OAS761]